MGKAPAFQFYPGDWRRDPALQMCSMSVQGIWVNLLCIMWEAPKRGVISGGRKDFCKILGVTSLEFTHFLSAIKTHCFGEISEENGVITIRNRRMVREEEARKANNDRVREFREKQSSSEICNKDVIGLKQECNTPSSSSSSSSISKNKYVVEKELFALWNSQNIITHRDFEKFKPHLTEALKTYSLDEIKAAVVNYAIVLAGDDYFFSYRWTLDQFLTRKNGIDRFLEINNPLETMRAHKNSEAKTEIINCREGLNGVL